MKHKTHLLVATWILMTSISMLHDANAAPSDGCFHVFDAMLFVGKPDLSPLGFERITVVNPDWWMPASKAGTLPDNESVEKGLSQKSQNAMLVLDAEDWPLTGASSVVTNSINQYVTLLSRVRSVHPNGPVGYYGGPVIRKYGGVISNAESSSYRAWQAQNDSLQPLAEAVDAIFPSIYTFFPDQAAWQHDALANVSEARRIAHGKPVFPFIWPQYDEQNKQLGLTLLPADYWTLQLNTMAQVADGIVIWGGYKVHWDDQAPWWQATVKFMQSKGHTCAAPKAPSSIQVQ